MTAVCVVIILIFAGSLGYIGRLIHKAPWGWEDCDGFHYGKRPANHD